MSWPGRCAWGTLRFVALALGALLGWTAFQAFAHPDALDSDARQPSPFVVWNARALVVPSLLLLLPPALFAERPRLFWLLFAGAAAWAIGFSMAIGETRLLAWAVRCAPLVLAGALFGAARQQRSRRAPRRRLAVSGLGL